MAKNKKIIWGITALSLFITAAAVPFMNDVVPMHYNAAGQADRWGSRYENFIFPGMIVLFSLFWTALLHFYEKRARNAEEEKTREEAKSNLKVLHVTAAGTTGLFAVLNCVFLGMALKGNIKDLSTLPFDVMQAACVLVGILLMVMGNYMPKGKKNSLIGVRTAWSRKDDKNWAASNRFGGISMMVTGVVAVLDGILLRGSACLLVLLAAVLLDGAVSVLYSYWFYRKNR